MKSVRSGTTGRMPSAHGVIFNDRSLEWNASTHVDAFRKAGWRTGLIGELHEVGGLGRGVRIEGAVVGEQVTGEAMYPRGDADLELGVGEGEGGGMHRMKVRGAAGVRCACRSTIKRLHWLIITCHPTSGPHQKTEQASGSGRPPGDYC